MVPRTFKDETMNLEIAMDPSIMKLLEEDEDESMHSGAEVEAFTAALNRDIEGDVSTSQPSYSDCAALPQGNSQTSTQIFPKWSSLDDSPNFLSQDPNCSQREEQNLSEMQLIQHRSGSDNLQQQVEISKWQAEAEQNSIHFAQAMGTQNLEKNLVHASKPDNDSQYPKLQKMSKMPAEQAINPITRSKQVPFALLLPVIQPQLDKDRAMQLQTLYLKLKKNEISKDGFVRHMRSIVGDQMLKMAVLKLQEQAARNPQTGPSQFSPQAQASTQQQHVRIPSLGAKQFHDPQSLMQLHQKGVSFHIPSPAAQGKAESSSASMNNNTPKSQEVECQSDSHGIRVSQISSSSFSAPNQEGDHPAIPKQGLTKQQQQHLHFSQPSFPLYANTGVSYHPFSGANVNASPGSLKQLSHDVQMRHIPVHQNMGATQLGTTQTMNVMSVPKLERQATFSEQRRVTTGTLSHSTNNSTLQQNSAHWQPSSNEQKSVVVSSTQKSGVASSTTYVKQEPVVQMTEQQEQQQQQVQLANQQGLSTLSSAQVEQGNAIPGTSKDDTLEVSSSGMGLIVSTSMMSSNSIPMQSDPSSLLTSQMPSASSPIGPESSAKTFQKKPTVGYKKPVEGLGSLPPLSSKKQKVSGAFLDQSIEQLNDVTAVSGVNLTEEEEQLFSGPKEDSQVSEASRKIMQEEEERLILQKLPLQKKLAEIMAKCGVKSIGNDVERCLSLSVEERMRGLISNLVRLSKQRGDIEKTRHLTVITSDVQQQIFLMNRKAKEEWEKKQADVEKLNEHEGNDGHDGSKEKDDGRAKSLKVNKEEDDKLRATAANVAARAAVGGDDILSKWQLMAEQARQKREGGIDVASVSQADKDVNGKTSTISGGETMDYKDAEKRGLSAAFATSGRKFGRNQVAMPQPRVACGISIKDVIAVLEREPQMSKSALIHRLHEKVRTDAVTE